MSINCDNILISTLFWIYELQIDTRNIKWIYRKLKYFDASQGQVCINGIIRGFDVATIIVTENLIFPMAKTTYHQV